MPGGKRMSSHKVKMDAPHAASLEAGLALRNILAKLDANQALLAEDIATAKNAVAANAAHERKENLALIGSPSFKRLKIIIAEHNNQMEREREQSAAEDARLKALTPRGQMKALPNISQDVVSRQPQRPVLSGETIGTRGWRTLAANEHLGRDGCEEAPNVRIGDKVSIGWMPIDTKYGPALFEVADCDADYMGSLDDRNIGFEACWIVDTCKKTDEEVESLIDSGYDGIERTVSIVVQDFTSHEPIRYDNIDLRFLRRCANPQSLWSGEVIAVHTSASLGATSIDIRHVGTQMISKCVSVKRIQELSRPQDGRFATLAASLTGDEELWKQRVIKMGVKTNEVTWLRRKSKEKRHPRIQNGAKVPTPEFRLEAALMCLKTRIHTTSLTYNADTDTCDYLRKQGWAVGFSTLRKWASRLKKMLGDPDCDLKLLTSLGKNSGAPVVISEQELAAVFRELCAARDNRSRAPVSEQTMVEKIRAVHKRNHLAMGYAAVTYKAMNEDTERRTLKKLMAFFRPGENARERSEGRQSEMTSVINAISEFCTANAIQSIPGKEGQFILKENLTNFDPTTFVYNLIMRGTGFGITLVPAHAKPSNTASVAARGGRKGLSHSMKVAIPADADGGKGPGHIIVKAPRSAAAGLHGENAKPIVEQINRFGGSAETQPMYLVVVIDPRKEDLSQTRSNSSTEEIFAAVIWPKMLAWMKKKAASATMNRGKDEDDDDPIYKRMALSIDSSLPEIKALLKWVETEEAQALNLGVRKIGSRYTGGGQAADAGDIHPTGKRKFRNLEKETVLKEMEFHDGVVDCIAKVNAELIRRHSKPGVDGSGGWGKNKELAAALTLFEQVYQEAWSRKNCMSGFIRTGEVSAAPKARRDAKPDFDQFVRQLSLTGGRPLQEVDYVKARHATFTSIDPPALLHCCKANGKLTDELFARHGYSYGTGDMSCSPPGEKPRDAMRMDRSRSCVINPEQALKGYREYEEAQVLVQSRTAAGRAVAAAKEAIDAIEAENNSVVKMIAAAEKITAAEKKRSDLEARKKKRKADAMLLTEQVKRLKGEAKELQKAVKERELEVIARLSSAQKRRKELHDEAVELTNDADRGDYDATNQCDRCGVHWNDWLSVIEEARKPLKRVRSEKFVKTYEFLERHPTMFNWKSADDDSKHWCPCCYELPELAYIEKR